MRRDLLGKLRWLVSHTPVQRARLELSSQGFVPVSRCEVFGVAASRLAPWAPSLQRLSMCLSCPPEEPLDWLGGLQQLTWLHLSVALVEPPHAALRCFSSLQRLRTLRCDVPGSGGGQPSSRLPPLSTSLQHIYVSSVRLGPTEPTRLTTLQTLARAAMRVARRPPGTVWARSQPSYLTATPSCPMGCPPSLLCATCMRLSAGPR